MDAMHKLINFGDPAASAIPHVIVLVAAAAFVGWLSAKTFKYQSRRTDGSLTH